LTEREAMVFQVLRKAGDALFKDLLKETKLKRAELTHALNRIVALGFAKKLRRKGETVYREIEQGKNK
jgi:DNA-binding MarR family transcriptional regulator